MDIENRYGAIVIGGGFFGCRLAVHLQNFGMKTLLLEMETGVLQRASYVNQARVHNGYHYPRSILTALRSHANFPRFVEEYPECINDRFDQYYAISKHFSKVSARQFKVFAERVGLEIAGAPDSIVALFQPGMIEEVFAVREYAFDAIRLKERMQKDLEKSGVEVKLGVQAMKIQAADREIRVFCKSSQGESNSLDFTARFIYNCTYSQTNEICRNSGFPLIPLKHEFTELAILELPSFLRTVGITVLCGPFFSFMPFPPRAGLHTLSHVRYTPHHEWQDKVNGSYTDAYAHHKSAQRNSNYSRMLRDAERYIPAIRESRYVDSIWEIKTVLPKSEIDDSRPILMKKDYGIPNFTCIMGAKIDNIYDVLGELPAGGELNAIA